MTTTPYQLMIDRTARNVCDDRGVPLPVFRATHANECVRIETMFRQRPGPRRPTRWLWDGRIPRGQVTLIEGDHGVGKSVVVADFLARVSRDLNWPLAGDEAVASVSESYGTSVLPGTRPPAEAHQPAVGSGGARALLVTRQDDSGVLDGRLEDQGVDLTRIVRVDRVETEVEGMGGDLELRPLQFPFDLSMLQHELRVQPGIELLVIDPLSDFCETPKRVAQTLRQLSDLARQTGVAIVVTLPAQCRFNAQGRLKVTSRYRTEDARYVWCVAIDPEDLERRLFVSTRMNSCRAPQGLAFSLADDHLEWDLHKGVSATDPLARESEIREFLATNLTEEGVSAQAVYRVGGEQGFTPAQLRAVGKRMGVKICKAPGFGKDGSWQWSLERSSTVRVRDEMSGGAPETSPTRGEKNSQNRKSLEKPAESGVDSVGVALAAMSPSGGLAGESLAKESVAESRVVGDTAVAATRHHVSAQAKTTDVTTTSPTGENSQNRKSLEKPAKSGVDSVVVALAAT
ncbi:MAG: AAA family ATPase, partial [Planctomycetes bacterium]|nr:AAA family ATPase [Planctomycetota bacterium]